jgi:hypothetical protein
MRLAARPDPLLTARGVLAGGWACLLAAATFALSLAQTRSDRTLGGLFNDFYDYWAAARVLNLGGSPYDKHLLVQVLDAAGVHSTVGTGYSYPLLLAEVGRPLGLLPPLPAAALFTLGSLAALGLAVALLLSPLQNAPAWSVGVLATGAGLFAPVDGTLYVGQVNLYLLPAAALAWRGTWRPASLAVASAVKLYPLATLGAYLALGRRGVRPLLTALAAAAGLTLLPNLLTGTWSYGVDVVQMFKPDPYWSNQSVNGFLSRLAMPSDWSRPPLPGLPVTPLMLVACALLGGATLALVLRGQRGRWPGAFALLLCYSVVAAPKNSLWNLTPLLVVLVHAWSEGRGRRWTAAVLGLVWALCAGIRLVDVLRGALPGHPVAMAWLSSLPLYGGLLLTGLLAYQALAAARPVPVAPSVEAPEVAA